MIQVLLGCETDGQMRALCKQAATGQGGILLHNHHSSHKLASINQASASEASKKFGNH